MFNSRPQQKCLLLGKQQSVASVTQLYIYMCVCVCGRECSEVYLRGGVAKKCNEQVLTKLHLLSLSSNRLTFDSQVASNGHCDFSLTSHRLDVS